MTENTSINQIDGSRMITNDCINGNERNEPHKNGKSVNFHGKQILFVHYDILFLMFIDGN